VTIRQPWTPAEEALCQVLTEQGRDSAEIAATFAERGIARTQKAIMRIRDRRGWHGKVQPSPVTLASPPVLRGDALLLFDVHSPCHDAAWINRCVDLALRWGVHKLGIGGDLVDFTAFSVFAKSNEYDVQTEIAATEGILRTLESCFDEVVYSAGNHEQRLSRLPDWLLPVETAMRLFMRAGRTTFTRSYWFTLESGGESYYIEHPRNVSVAQTLVPARLAAKYHTHVIAGHGHLWGQGRDVSGRYWAIDSGMAADPARLEYYVSQHNVRPAMQQGAVIVRGGVPVLLSPGNIAFYDALWA
jgi:hypothetical protein